VQVRRPGLTTTTALQVTPRKPSADVNARLAAAMAHPVGAIELPLSISAYAVRGDQRDTLKVILFVEIDDAAQTADRTPAQFALRILAGEKALYETNGAATVDPQGAHVLLATQLPAGSYVVKLGAVEAARSGTATLPIAIDLVRAGPIRLSQLIPGTSAEGFRPAITIRGDRVSAMFEAYADAPADLAGLAATFELRRPGDPAVLRTAQGVLSQPGDPGRRVVEGELSTAGLAPGVYRIAALVRRENAEIGRTEGDVRVMGR
jgi:hypothetical protein